MQETWVQNMGQEDPLEKKMVTHCSILAWEIPWTEEPGWLHCMGSQKSQTRLSNKTATTMLFSSSVVTLCDPIDCGMPGFPVLHHLLELAQTHVH